MDPALTAEASSNWDAQDQEDFDFLMRNAREGRARALSEFLHLDHPVGIWNYIRIANEIASRIPRGRLLDWGCGFGQMTYLLRRRGFEVVAFDVKPPDYSFPDIPLCRQVDVITTTHPTRLPFEDRVFDVVLSCGVLEHVDEMSEPGNEILSLREIKRVLRLEGHFLIYQLPQRYSWAEAVGRTLRRGYSHPRRFTAEEIRALLARAGYHIEHMNRNNLFPKNLTGMPEGLRAFYSRFSRAIIAADKAICRIPGLNRVAGVMELYARPVRNVLTPAATDDEGL